MANSKIVDTFTLSSYFFGQHTVDGRTPKQIVPEYNSASFAETLSPLHGMIDRFCTLPTGTKIKVTMEVVKTKKPVKRKK